jgi:hypothetical protein
MRPRHRLEHVRRWVCAILLVGLFVAGASCSSSSGGTNGAGTDATIDGNADDGTGDVADVRDPSKNCVPPGATGNEKGVGAYCEPGDAGVPCDKEAGSPICTGAIDGVPDTAWFCTRPCSKDTDCGTNAFCVTNPLGTGCVPAACLGDDAGVDASSG